eukprot:jgi/Mesen1/7405/ME000388S06624
MPSEGYSRQRGFREDSILQQWSAGNINIGSRNTQEMQPSLTSPGNPRVRSKIFPSQQDKVNGIQDRVPYLEKRHESGWELRRSRQRFVIYGLLMFTALLLCSLSFNGRHLLSRHSKAKKVDTVDGLATTGTRKFIGSGRNASIGVLQLPAATVESQTPVRPSLRFDPEHEPEVALVEDPMNDCAKQSSTWQPQPSKSSGYLMVRCNGGLNQMRAAICDMVAIARHINATMVIPELDKTSFWADPSDFGDVFDMNHFINSLKGEVKVITRLPPKYRMIKAEDIYTMDPVSWSDIGYYSKVVYPLLKKHKILRLNRTDSRLANNAPDVPKALQRLRCRVQYHDLQFTRPIRILGQRIINRLLTQGPFIALHLRYEMDMLAFTGCTHGCTPLEERKLTKLRFRTERWKEKEIDGAARRAAGECPLTPEEVGLMLRAMGYGKDTQVFIASGKIYGGKRRMARLLSIFPNTVRKEMLVTAEELAPFRNHSSQLAALDYMVTVAADVFLSTFHGNMARLVEGHRRYLGHRKTILPDRKKLVELFEEYENRTINWAQFSRKVRTAHMHRIGAPQERVVLAGRPKEEDNFFQNPQECICDKDKERAWEEIRIREAKLSSVMHEEAALGSGSAGQLPGLSQPRGAGQLSRARREALTANENSNYANRGVHSHLAVADDGGDSEEPRHGLDGGQIEGLSEAMAGVKELEEVAEEERKGVS